MKMLDKIASNEQLLEFYLRCRKDWNLFAREWLDVRLDNDQQEILHAIQANRRVSVRSGTARGKDFVAAVASVAFLFLNIPSKVINTAPTGRQVTAIMLPEIARLYKNAQKIGGLGGRLMADGIRFEEDRTWYLMGFKADDKNTEAWSGFHSPNLMVVVTEASGIEQQTFDAIEGILQGNSRLVIVFNPNNLKGEAYESARSPQYKSFKLNCLNSPNVKARKIVIPGQVDYDWVNEKVLKKGWTMEIHPSEVDPNKFDFEWNGKYYRPGDLFRVKVLGEFPEEDSGGLIPLAWIEQANDRWIEYTKGGFRESTPARLGVDVAGMGTDNSVIVDRYGFYVKGIHIVPVASKDTIHMQVAGQVKQALFNGGQAFIDTIGEGAGVYSRLREMKVLNAYSCKNSENAKGLYDATGVRRFVNMRSYMYWALRDALDPSGDIKLMLPPDDELKEELCEIHYMIQSDSRIILEPKEDIKKRLGRSPDKADALSMTFYPEARVNEELPYTGEYLTKEDFGIF